MNVIERNIRRIDGAQQRHTIPAFLIGVMKKFGDDNAGALTVQMTYRHVRDRVSPSPRSGHGPRHCSGRQPLGPSTGVNSAFGQFPIVGQQLAHNLHAMKRSSVFGLVVGVIGLVYGSTGLAQAGLYSMGQIWNIPSAVRPNYLTRMTRSHYLPCHPRRRPDRHDRSHRLRHFRPAHISLGILGEFLAVLVNVGLYFAAFRALTPKQVATRSLLPGVVVGAIAWTVLQAVGGYVVGHDLKGASAVYGMFGLVLGLMAWIYLAAEITLYAAELNSVLFHRLWPRSMVQPPLTEADQRSLAFQATENQRRPEQVVTTYFRSRPMKQDEYRERGYKPDDSTPGIERTEPGENPATKAGR